VDMSLLTSEKGEYISPHTAHSPYKRKGGGVKIGGGERGSIFVIPDYDYYDNPEPKKGRIPIDRRRPHTTAGGDDGKKKKKKEDEYQWITDYLDSCKPYPKSSYSRQLDGQDMPKSKQFRRPPTMQFSRADRFDAPVFEKINPSSGIDSPGPKYGQPVLDILSQHTNNGGNPLMLGGGRFDF